MLLLFFEAPDANKALSLHHVFVCLYVWCIYFCIDPVGKLLFREKKSILVTGTAPFPPLCSFGRGYNSVIIASVRRPVIDQGPVIDQLVVVRY